MIKKAALLLTAPFLMVFSDYSLSLEVDFTPYSSSDLEDNYNNLNLNAAHSTCSTRPNRPCDLSPAGSNGFWRATYRTILISGEHVPSIKYRRYYYSSSHPNSSIFDGVDIIADESLGCSDPVNCDPYIPAMSDEECSSSDGNSLTVPIAVANSLNSGGSFKTHGGACSVTSSGQVSACFPLLGTCSIGIDSTSTGLGGLVFPDDSFFDGSASDLYSGDFIPDSSGTFSVIEFTPPSYLTSLGSSTCSDNSSCFSIGDESYLVDWESAPDYFEYVGTDGTTYSSSGSTPPSGGSDSGGSDSGGSDSGGSDSGGSDSGGSDSGGSDSGGSDSGGSDSGGSTGGGSDSGGSTGGGSTVPDFEFDESGIIEAIRSSGQSNRNSIDALSNDVTSAISNQTSELNASTTQQTQALTEKINAETSRLITESDNQTGRVTTAITSQTQSVQNTIDTQTGSLNSSINDLKTSLVDALGNIKVRFSGGSSSGNGSSDGEGEGDEEGDGVDGFLDSLVDKLASKFTEDLGSEDDLFDSSGMDETLDGIAEEEDQHTEDVQGLMDEIGEDDSSGIADQVASLIPSMPSGGCTPMTLGPMEISCRPFNLIKSWLTWALYVYSVISIINTFFRSEQRMA